MDEEMKKSILIWGVHGVGKTSMINSLPQELEKLSREDGVIFKLVANSDDINSAKDVRFRAKYEKVEPTKIHNANSLNLIASSGKNPGLTKTYNLIFVDDKGDEMRAAVDKTDATQNNPIRSYLDRYAEGVIALFEYEIEGGNSQKKYENADLLINLLDVLTSRNDEVFLAICINKIDKTLQRWKNPMIFFEIVFGHHWSNVLNVIKVSKNNNVKIEFFVTSMVGYFRNGQGDTVPNFSDDDVIDSDILRPWNVASPLFWILENIEGSSNENWFLSYFKIKDKKNIVFPKPFF